MMLRKDFYMILIFVIVSALTSALAVTYTSCADVLQKSLNSANKTVPQDGQYIITLQGSIAISIYCAGFATRSPKEYITLVSGRSSNYASVYNLVGSDSSCAPEYPETTYNQSGRTEFSRLRIYLPQLTVELKDFRFSVTYGKNNISYASAGDMFSYIRSCPPLGKFSIDLQGTPFVISPDVRWQWTGKFVDRTGNGQAIITNNTYIGCFKDFDDRLLPGFVTNANGMTPDKCISLCLAQGFHYAGVQFMKECYCGNSHSKHDRTQESDCNTPCDGDNSRMCGGTWAISVYSTEVGQALSGFCGGYPGQCFPTLSSQPYVAALKLIISPHQPCQNQKVCSGSDVCIAVTEMAYQCMSSKSLKPVVSNSEDCPMGRIPIQCGCASNCTGARFNGNNCLAKSGKPQVTCVASNPGHLKLTDVQGSGTVFCPKGSTIVGCSYWDTASQHSGNGLGAVDPKLNKCSVTGCSTCTVYARCQAYSCGCENGATCNPVTGECVCPPGYYGEQCEVFDYCSYAEDHSDTHAPVCNVGTCKAIPTVEIRTFGTSPANSSKCVFPFLWGLTYDSDIFTTCLDTNIVGPPFACATYFDGVNDYVNLGSWNPGAIYTIAIWVSPTISDHKRRTIIGGVYGCRDFGLYLQDGFFYAYYSPSDKSCSTGLKGSSYNLADWYLLALTNNGTYLSLYVNGNQVAQTSVQSYYLGTSAGTYIAGSTCCADNFQGYIKSVKIWNQVMTINDISGSMSAVPSLNATQEALYQGLVAYFELGRFVNVSCQGINHGGEDWTLEQDEEVSGIHCNVDRMFIPQGITARVAAFDGTNGGNFEVYAEEIHISGFLTAAGKGYRGGASPTDPGQGGLPGESYHITANVNTTNMKLQNYQAHRGGGGGGGIWLSGGLKSGSPGGGGGYGTAGGTAAKNIQQRGEGGQVYGTSNIEQLYLGSGGGSGGNAPGFTNNPRGGRGGNGGGAIGLYARGVVQILGLVSVAGEDGQGDTGNTTGCSICPAACQASNPKNCFGNSGSACWDYSGPGGGGSGGSVYIIGSAVDIGFDHVWIQGGNGGLGANSRCGGAGGYGRLRVNAVSFTGSVPLQGTLNVLNSTTFYQDLSLGGQKLITYSSNVQYGNEIYRGCFQDDAGNRHFAFTLPLSEADKKQMSPQYCTAQCRKRGYAFSAVEYGFECYCDNSFVASLKKSDDDCNQPCSGDSRQFCGAGNRMSVYGPKPFLPVSALNGAKQECRSWCITGNMYSNSPSWGYCDLSSMEITDYQTLCQCPDGYQGDTCTMQCSQGYWGPGCLKVCICNATNTGSCNPVDGTCICNPGYQGGTCDLQCSPGTFGAQCKGRCACSNNSVCDAITGKCRCADGWYGPGCNFPCPPTTYGPSCTKSCRCFFGSCSPVDGTCTCDPGYKLPFCAEKCDPTNYGPNCMMECDCHGQTCDSVSGICSCSGGYTGRRCEQLCPHGTYGDQCGLKCQCLNGAGCDHEDGECFCAPGWTGPSCNMTCLPWKYGPDCVNQCTCQQGNTANCDTATGVCNCKPGFTGDACNIPCPTGYFGQNCAFRCPCYNNAPCDKTTGQCQCPSGFSGSLCDQSCPSGRYGPNCGQVCNVCSTGLCSKVDGTCICTTGGNCISCPSGYFGSQCSQVCKCVHGSCDSSTGRCTCNSGWQGVQCDQPCPAGTYGSLCSRKCQCKNGNCSSEDGYCSCFPGYKGLNCDQRCSNGTFGILCSGTCQQCGPGSVNFCDPVTGNCICKPGYTGMQCDRPCPSNTYGPGCVNISSCNQGTANNVDGSCQCSPGWTGPQCNQQCKPGRWGPGCTNNCSCGVHAIGCDSSSGMCICATGFTGAMCHHSCPPGTFGSGCSKQCACATASSQCSPIDGSCICLPGYFGPNCILCPANTYGPNCSLPCQCSGHGSCDNLGNCICEPGYVGKQCQSQCEQNLNWGKDCAQKCNCSFQMCDPRTGICKCDKGKWGQRCEKVCDSSHFGIQCTEPCLCKNNATCDPQTGTCGCQPGWDGPYCDKSCAVGKYGQGCSSVCLCTSGTACDGKTGKCNCQPGFMGINCNISCPVGYWDVNCVTKCSTSCQAGCFSDSGICKCTQRSCLAGSFCSADGVCVIQQGSSGGGLSGGQTAGVVIGFILALLLVGGGVYIIMQRKNSVIIDRIFSMYKGDHDDSSRGLENPIHFAKENEKSGTIHFRSSNEDSAT